MAKKPKTKSNVRLAQKSTTNPVKLIARVLVLIGKPIYFVISSLIYALFFFLSLIGRIANKTIKQATSSLKWRKGRKAKKEKIKKGPSILTTIRLKELRISLLILKILGRIKSFFTTKFSKFQKFQLKKKITFFVFIGVIVTILSYSYFSIFKDLPSPSELISREPEVSTKIYDRNGNLLYRIYKDKNRTLVSLNDIPKNVQLATLAAEDAEFYDHIGFSVKGIFRAIFTNFKNGSLQGGSTITQQLVKNTLLTPEKTITRKIKELVLSIEVERNYSKDKILEMYMNEVSYGGTAYGIEAAAESYFGKNVNDLNLAEGAFLAGLPKSPTLYSPFGENSDLAFEREREVLHLMRINKFISTEDEQKALNTRLTFVPNKKEIKAPHFVMYIRQLLVDKYGEEMVEKGGLEVTTSLDLPIQEASEKIVSDEVGKLKNLNVGNGAALVLNPKNGEIIAMVGSKNYFDIASDGNVNIAIRVRQPGSSIKVVNYAYALSHGYTPASIIDDSPITYVTPGSAPYSPVNYDGKFLGKITLRSALAQSRNIPAVKVLASYGVKNMIEQGKNMGITTWNDSSQYGLSLTLGGGAVKMIDLAKVYSVIANYGKRPEINPILQIKDYKGKILEQMSEVNQEQVLDPRVAYTLVDILKDNIARSPEFGFNSSLVVKDHPEVAVKTGTSNDLRDNWTAGFNQDYLTITWVGNNNNSPMNRIASGITGAAPIWNKIMSVVLKEKPSIDWKVPDGISKVNICTITSSLPCDSCPTRQEWFLDENKPKKSCSPDQLQKISPKSISPNKILETGASTINN